MSLTSYRTAPPRGRSADRDRRRVLGGAPRGQRRARRTRDPVSGLGCEARRDHRRREIGEGQGRPARAPLRSAPAPGLRAPGAARQRSANARGRADRRVGLWPTRARRGGRHPILSSDLAPLGAAPEGTLGERPGPCPGLATTRSPPLGGRCPGRSSDPASGHQPRGAPTTGFTAAFGMGRGQMPEIRCPPELLARPGGDPLSHP
jgi:hypothetical protein